MKNPGDGPGHVSVAGGGATRRALPDTHQLNPGRPGPAPLRRRPRNELRPEFPPIRVFNDGSDVWLSRGFHRYHAAKLAGLESVEAEQVQGTRRDAVLDALGDNATHGVRRTNQDKRKAVMTLLEDEEWSSWSDSEMARRTSVSHQTVGRIRQDHSLVQSASEPAPRTYTDRHGNTGTMNTANIGKSNSDRMCTGTSLVLHVDQINPLFPIKSKPQSC